LQELNIRGCGKNFMYIELRTIYVTDCSELEELSGFESLNSLLELHVYRCLKLKRIRGSAKLTKLKVVGGASCIWMCEAEKHTVVGGPYKASNDKRY